MCCAGLMEKLCFSIACFVKTAERPQDNLARVSSGGPDPRGFEKVQQPPGGVYVFFSPPLSSALGRSFRGKGKPCVLAIPLVCKGVADSALVCTGVADSASKRSTIFRHYRKD